MNQNRRLLEETTRMKRLMTTKSNHVITEESKYTVSDTVTRFVNNSDPSETSINDGILNLLNSIDRKTFLDFQVELNKRTGKNFNTFINSKFKDSDGADALKLQQILKSRFNIDSDASVSGTQYMNPRQRVFQKRFKITNYNSTPVTNTNTDLGKERVVKTGPNPTDFVVVKPGEQAPPEWKPEQTKKETTTPSSQTYNDILSGKGVLKTGVTSPAVGELQQKLLDLGYSAIAKPTNYFGTETYNAVKDFQEKNSLTVDGKVGGNTSKKIDQILDIRKRRSASQGEVVPGVPDAKLPDTSISGLSNQKSTTTTTTSPNTRGLTTAVQSYVPKGVSRTADFS